jgi:formylglycine-generating enzyme required for sulfatase activity
MFELAHAHHFAGEQREFLLEELCHFAALGIAPPEFEQLARRQFRLVCDHLATLDPTQPESVLVSFWAQRVAMQMPPQALRWNELSDCLRLATELMSQVQPHARFDVPEGLNIWPAPPTQEHDPSGAWWRLWQCGNKQTIRPVEDQVPPPPPPNVPGGSLAFIRAGGPWFEVRCQADQAIAPGPAQRHWLCAGPGHEAGVDIGGVHTIEVISDRQIISLTPVSSSSWHRMGCDGYGLYAEICIAGIAHRMRWIGPGTFQMGSPEDEPERYPDERLHQVTLTRGFWLGETACPQSLWQAVIGNNPSRFKNEGKSGSGADRPVENVSWEDCQAFFDKANGLLDRDDLRLPTEAEWEYACRAGTVSPFWFGQELTSEQANFSETKREETAGVMEFPCNGWGLYQMHGNVWEWCQDWYTQSLEGPAEDPQGPNEGAARVLRGGSWIKSARICRSACRFWYLPSDRYENLGFRLARGQ